MVSELTSAAWTVGDERLSIEVQLRVKRNRKIRVEESIEVEAGADRIGSELRNQNPTRLATPPGSSL